MLNVRSRRPVFWNIFLKFSAKHLPCSPNISQIFNRPPENRFNNRQNATHIEQLTDAWRQFMCLYLLYQKRIFLPFPVIRGTFHYMNGALREATNETFLSFCLCSSNIKNPENFFNLKSITKHNKIVLIWTQNKLL